MASFEVTDEANCNENRKVHLKLLYPTALERLKQVLFAQVVLSFAHSIRGRHA